MKTATEWLGLLAALATLLSFVLKFVRASIESKRKRTEMLPHQPADHLPGTLNSATLPMNAPIHFHRIFVYSSPIGGRASTTRQRLPGTICCLCKIPLEPDSTRRPSQRYCDRCQPRHRVYMHFMLTQDGWHCQFLKDDLKTSLPRKLTFQDPDKLIDIARKGGAEFTSAERQALEFGISRGRGAVWLNLTAEQLNKLKR